MYRMDVHDKQCIAPSPKYGQCSLPIDDEEAQEIASLAIEIQRMECGPQRESLVRRVVLLRCCGEYHRQKLEVDRQALDRLAGRYAQVIKEVPKKTIPIKQAPPPIVAISAETNKARYCLRPRETERLVQAGLDLEFDSALFVPYYSMPKDNVEGVLTSDLSKSDMRPSNVYAFSWPTAPGYIKIGESKNVRERLQAWQSCHPGAALIHSIAVPQAKRVERLIHLEMSRERHQIILCSRCSRTHYEWFKRPAKEVKEVMEAWKQVISELHPYNQEGSFNNSLEDRLSKTNRELTANRILGVHRATALTSKTPQAFKTNARRTAPIVGTVYPRIATSLAVTMTPISDGDALARRDWDLVVRFFYDFWRTI
jgi:hypothetical protein